VIQATVGSDVERAIEQVAHFGRALAGAQRQVDLASAERDEMAMLYHRAQKALEEAIKAAREAAGEPVNL